MAAAVVLSVHLSVHLIATTPSQMQTNTTLDGSPVLQFNGGPESYVTIPHELSFQPLQGFTFTTWLQQDPGNMG